MDALVCIEPGKLEVQDRPRPARPSGFVLARPRRVGICGTDYHIFEGKHPFLEYPRVMGHELAVEIVEPDEKSEFAAGDLAAVNPYLSCGDCIACRRGKSNCCVKIAVLGVHTDGGMTELISLPTRNLVRADGLTVDQCATVEFLAIGAHAVRRGVVTSNDRVLVVGAGPIGLGVALFARIAGGDVSILDVDADRVRAAKDIAGATGLVPGDDILETIMAATNGDGFDVLLDATGNQASMEKAFDFVAAGGRYVFVSVVTGDITFSDPAFHRREMTLIGSRNATSEDFSHVISAIRGGDVDIGKIVTHRTTLRGAVEDLPRWASQKSGLIKALIEI